MKKVKIQQGDLILVHVSEMPKAAKRVEIKGASFIMLRGEGVNTHEIQSETLTNDVEVYQDGDVLYIKTKKDVPLVHQEHGTTIINKGSILERRIEREWDYEEEEARNTRD